MPKKIDIVPINERLILDAQAALAEAATFNFEQVIIFGYKDGQCTTLGSNCRNRQEVIGALEEAKMMLWAQARFS